MTTSTESSVDELCHQHDPHALDGRSPEGELRPSGHADGARAAGLPALHAGDEAQPGEPGLVRPRPLRPVRGARLDAALLDAPPGRLRADARGPRELPPARQPDRRATPSTSTTPRASRPPPGRWARASPCRSAWRSPSACWPPASTAGDSDLIDHHTYVIASDGDIQEGVALGGLLARRPPRARQADRLLRRQPHPARGPDRDGLQRGRGQALRGLRLARPGRRRGHRPRDARARVGGRRRAWRTSRRSILVRTHIGYGSPNKRTPTRRTARRSARTRCRLTKEVYGWPTRRALLRARRGARALPRGRASAAGRRPRSGRGGCRPTASEHPGAAEELELFISRRLPDGWDADRPDVRPGRRRRSRPARHRARRSSGPRSRCPR